MQNDYQEVQTIHLRSILLTKNLFDAEALWSPPRLHNWFGGCVTEHDHVLLIIVVLIVCSFLASSWCSLFSYHLYYVRCHTGQVIPKLFTPVMAHTRNIRLLRRFCVCLLMFGFVLFNLVIKLIIIRTLLLNHCVFYL